MSMEGPLLSPVKHININIDYKCITYKHNIDYKCSIHYKCNILLMQHTLNINMKYKNSPYAVNTTYATIHHAL